MALDKDLIADIQKHADIVRVISSYISVTKKGRDYVAKCPFHDDHDPSMHISPEKQIFKCFVCGVSGSVFKFVQNIENISFYDAVKKVAELIDYHDPRLEKGTFVKRIDKTKEPLYSCLKDLTSYYQYSLNTEEGQDGLKYLQSRHLDNEIRQQFDIGYAPKDGLATIKLLQMKNHSLKAIEDAGISALRDGSYYDKNQGRVIFPIRDKDGNIVGYSARNILDDGEAKYVNTQETPIFHKSSILYNFHNVKKFTQLEKYVYVVEGFMDAIALYKVGIKSAVALMGTAFTNEHLKMLHSLNVEIRLCLDGDKAGQDATFKIAQLLYKNNIPFRVVNAIGYKKDSDEILNELGKEGLLKYINGLLHFNDFLISYFTNTRKLTSINEKNELINTMLPFLHEIRVDIERRDYIHKLAKITGYEPDAINDIVRKTRYKESAEVKKIIAHNRMRQTGMMKLFKAEEIMVKFMVHDELAIKFIKDNNISFYDAILEAISKLILERYEEKKSKPSISELMSLVEISDIQGKEEVIQEITTLSEELIIPCDESILRGVYETIKAEIDKINKSDRIKQILSNNDEDKQVSFIENEIRAKRRKM